MNGRKSVAVFSGPTATIQNTAPLVTSNKARDKYGLKPLPLQGGDIVRAQRLAAEVTVYVEAFTAHPLERDAAYLYAPPDGYLDASGDFHRERRADDDKPVYEVVLGPEDGLYMLPYMARRSDGGAWEEAGTSEDADGTHTRQTFYADAHRLFEEIDRFGLDRAGRNGLLSELADYAFIRAAPSGGYTAGLPAALRTDSGTDDIPPEVRGRDFFYYHPQRLARSPARETLARVTNLVQESLASGLYDGAIWLEGSPVVEETSYWLNLLIDTGLPICGNAAQKPHGTLSSDGDVNIVDSVRYICSGSWAGSDGRDQVGVVVVQDGRIFASREVQKADARPGGYVSTGGHGGVVGSVAEGRPPAVFYVPTRRHTHSSLVNMSQIPSAVDGVEGANGGVKAVPVVVKNQAGELLGEAIPKVTFCKFARYQMDGYEPTRSSEVEIQARVEENLRRSPLAGFVLEGNGPFGRSDESMTASLRSAVMSGMPVVNVGRGNTAGFASRTDPLFVSGSNLTATKARLLLMACLLRFGAVPPARIPSQPTDAERQRARRHLDKYQEVFDTH